MRYTALRWAILLVATASITASLSGCGQPDSPKMAEAPTFTPDPNPEPPKLKGRKESYGSNKKYQDAMERANSR